ncbi:MAG: hypothetical protein AAB316_11960 [Bacteroidota bacterium]
MKAKISLLFLLAAFAASTQLSAQATLSVQGTLQKSFGSAVDDGGYSLTFKIYTVESGGTPIWTETQDDVEIVNGVYSVLLGEVEPLTVPFDEVYFVGVAVNSGAELIPRTQLTSSPYALSLIGTGNIFPSTGTIGAGTASPAAGYELHAKDAAGDAKVLVEGSENAKIVLDGGTGAEIEFVNGSDTASITYDGTNITVENLNLVFSAGISLPAGQTITYNGLSDWRLVDVDDFSTGTDGWVCHEQWNSNTVKSFERVSPGTTFSQGYLLRPLQHGNDALKKQFDLTGIPHTQVKVVFTFHYFDTWSDFEWGFGGFATSPLADNFQDCWFEPIGVTTPGHTNYNQYPSGDLNKRYEMVMQNSGDLFWVVFGTSLDQTVADEGYGISNIEIWVK